MKKISYLLIFTVWLGITLFVRTLSLDKSPQSVGFDEASLAYNAYSILKTGHDEYGNLYPLSLRSYNDFKPALYSYLAIPFIYLFDLNDAAIRMPSALLGTLSLVFLFLILRKTGKPRHVLVDLFLATVISFFPWRLHFSRVAFEANVSMVFFTGMVWCLINFSKNLFYKLGVILFSTLAIYSYHSSRIAVPALIFFYLVDPLSLNIKTFFKKPFNTIKKLWPLLILFILYIPLLNESGANQLLTRFTQTNLFSHFYPYTPREVIFTSNVWANPIGNPLYYLSAYISGHILAYISPKNLSLLIYPGVIKSAQVIAGSGMLGFMGGIFFTFGLVIYFREFLRVRQLKNLVYWILAGVIPAAATWEWFYPLRSLNIYPALDIVAALGLFAILNYFYNLKKLLIKTALITSILGVIFVVSIYNILNELGYGSWETSGEFQPGGFKQGVPLLMSLKDNYKTVYLDSGQAQSYELFWYYMKYPPEKVQALAPYRNVPGVEGPPVISFDNFVYKKYHWPDDKNMSSFIYWTDSEVKEEEIMSTKGAKLYKIYGTTGNWAASIITKD